MIDSECRLPGRRRAECGLRAAPVAEELRPAPAAFDVLRRLAALPHPLFLDSALSSTELGRYSFVCADPFDWLSSRGRTVELASRSRPIDADPFAFLAQELARYPAAAAEGLPPFQGGAAGLLGYDLCHHIERLPRPAVDEFQTPDLALGFYDWVVAFDHFQNRAWIISTGLPETEPVRRRRRANERLAMVRGWLERGMPDLSAQRFRCRPVTPSLRHPLPQRAGLESNFDRGSYRAAIQRAIDYVHAGDCFQVNIAQRLLVPAREHPLELYGRLRRLNPAPFAGYFDLGDFAIASASPERFLCLAADQVETRPIKGTRPRGNNPDDDRRLRDELSASAKDRAENVMIVDLLRNDLGRVCRYGSVRVEAVCRLETYQFVHHLVSVVRGELRPGLGPVDLVRAAFPGGSVTGAPKVRAMQIIAQLEPTARGPYCGCLGYLGFDGRMDTNLLIRTFTIGRGWCQFPVGGGIVADSSPEREYAETWHKAQGLLRALVD